MLRYTYRAKDSSDDTSARRPQYIIADTQAECPSTDVGDGDLCYCKDLDAFHVRADGAWTTLAGEGGGGPLAGDVDGDPGTTDLDEAAVETELEAVLDLADMQGSLTLAGDVDGSHGANDLDEAAAEAEIESVVDLADLQGTLPAAKGGTGAAPGAADQVLVSDSTSAATWKSVPDCTDTGGNHLNYTASSNTLSCGTSSSGGGSSNTSFVFLAADDARSVTAKNNLSGMAFTLSANTNYSWSCNMYTTSNATTVGVQFAVTFGGTVTAVRSLFQGPGAATTLLWSADTSFQVDHNPASSQGNVAGMVTLSGTVEVSGTGGTLQFQHGSETATLTTVQRGSWCMLARY